MYHLTIVVLLAAAAQSTASAPPLVKDVEETIQSDPDLLYHHQGYMAFLASPRMASSKAAVTRRKSDS